MLDRRASDNEIAETSQAALGVHVEFIPGEKAATSFGQSAHLADYWGDHPFGPGLLRINRSGHRHGFIEHGHEPILWSNAADCAKQVGIIRQMQIKALGNALKCEVAVSHRCLL